MFTAKVNLENLLAMSCSRPELHRRLIRALGILFDNVCLVHGMRIGSDDQTIVLFSLYSECVRERGVVESRYQLYP